MTDYLSKFLPFMFPPFLGSSALLSPRRILLQRSDRLGDVILTMPTIAMLHDRFPDAEIHMMTSAIGHKVMAGHPLLQRVWVVDRYERSPHVMADWVTQIREMAYDVSITLCGEPCMARLAKRAGIPVRIGDGSNLLQRHWYTHTIWQNSHDYTRHQSELNQDFLLPLGIAPHFNTWGFYPITHRYDALDTWRHDGPDQPIAYLFLTTGGSNVPIPDRLISPLITLLQRKGYRVVLDGDRERPEWPTTSGVLNVTGQTQLSDVMAIIHQVELVVAGDTGPTHMASMMGRPSVVFTSRKVNPPTRWGSLSPYQAYVRHDYPCDYDCRKMCHPDVCFQAIGVSDFEQAIARVETQQTTRRPLSMAAIKHLHVLQSLRCLIWRPHTMAPTVEEATDEWPMVVYWGGPGWRWGAWQQFKQVMMRYNINVVMGPVPWWMKGVLHVWMGTIRGENPPLVIRTDATGVSRSVIVQRVMQAVARVSEGGAP